VDGTHSVVVTSFDIIFLNFGFLYPKVGLGTGPCIAPDYSDGWPEYIEIFLERHSNHGTAHVLESNSIPIKLVADVRTASGVDTLTGLKTQQVTLIKLTAHAANNLSSYAPPFRGKG
jgi:hypothetical protein